MEFSFVPAQDGHLPRFFADADQADRYALLIDSDVELREVSDRAASMSLSSEDHIAQTEAWLCRLEAEHAIANPVVAPVAASVAPVK